MSSPTPKSKEEEKESRKRAKKLKPPIKEFTHTGADIYKEFNIRSVGTNLPRQKWIEKERLRRQFESSKLVVKIPKTNKIVESLEDIKYEIGEI